MACITHIDQGKYFFIDQEKKIKSRKINKNQNKI